MAIKKSELYSSLWASCDELRGGMDPSQYKDYILVLLFVKYVSDKYADDPDAIIQIPKGGSFKDMQALKGNKEIGDQMNIIIGKLAKANDLVGVIDVADFADDDKLGKGKAMIDTLTKLISIFESSFNFSKNRVGGDDILGDAFEYLMKNFATESGKSKGQFYTPSEVSRVMAQVLNISNLDNNNDTTFYDPTCGSGSLLLKALDEADGEGSLYGQEKDVATAALAQMNMILHGNVTAKIHRGQSTLSDPSFKDKNGYLKTFDFVVANPPFSSKNWATGFNPQDDLYGRFENGTIPPDKNGDYAFLLHIIKSLKSTGKGACILPHGVLFRGNAESQIRKNLIERGYIKGIIGLPANLFYGTSIPACIIVIDKEGADKRKTIFMVDASRGYIKDGNKNRLREQDIHKIVDIFKKQVELPKFSRLVSIEEISDSKNDYNLNIPRYIDSQETEDQQDIEAHLLGGIPSMDIEAMSDYWKIYPSLKNELFEPSSRVHYYQLKISPDKIKQSIFSHPEFVNFSQEMNDLFKKWKKRNVSFLRSLIKGIAPKNVIFALSECMLKLYADKALMNKYDVYQHLMNYWNESMQDDCYLIAQDGWKAEPKRIIVTQKTKGKEERKIEKGWDCDLIPKTWVIDRYFLNDKKAIEQLEANKDAIETQLADLEAEHNMEEGYFSEFEKVNKASLQKAVKTLEISKLKTNNIEEIKILKAYLKGIDDQATLNKKIKEAVAALDAQILARYKTLTEEDIKQLVIEDKWMATIESRIRTEMERISQRLTQRIKELAERYETPLPQQIKQVTELENKVNVHLQEMGFIWV